MSEAVQVAIIVSIPPTFAVLVTAWFSAKKLEKVHTLVNSRLSEALGEIKRLQGVVSKQGDALDETGRTTRMPTES